MLDENRGSKGEKTARDYGPRDFIFFQLDGSTYLNLLSEKQMIQYNPIWRHLLKLKNGGVTG